MAHGVGLFRGRKGATELSETLAAALEGSVSFVETLLFSANRSRGCCPDFYVCTKSGVDVLMYLCDSRKICLIYCPVYMYAGLYRIYFSIWLCLDDMMYSIGFIYTCLRVD